MQATEADTSAGAVPHRSGRCALPLPPAGAAGACEQGMAISPVWLPQAIRARSERRDAQRATH